MIRAQKPGKVKSLKLGPEPRSSSTDPVLNLGKKPGSSSNKILTTEQVADKRAKKKAKQKRRTKAANLASSPVLKLVSANKSNKAILPDNVAKNVSTEIANKAANIDAVKLVLPTPDTKVVTIVSVKSVVKDVIIAAQLAKNLAATVVATSVKPVVVAIPVKPDVVVQKVLDVAVKPDVAATPVKVPDVAVKPGTEGTAPVKPVEAVKPLTKQEKEAKKAATKAAINAKSLRKMINNAAITKQKFDEAPKNLKKQIANITKNIDIAKKVEKIEATKASIKKTKTEKNTAKTKLIDNKLVTNTAKIMAKTKPKRDKLAAKQILLESKKQIAESSKAELEKSKAELGPKVSRFSFSKEQRALASAQRKVKTQISKFDKKIAKQTALLNVVKTKTSIITASDNAKKQKIMTKATTKKNIITNKSTAKTNKLTAKLDKKIKKQEKKRVPVKMTGLQQKKLETMRADANIAALSGLKTYHEEKTAKTANNLKQLSASITEKQKEISEIDADTVKFQEINKKNTEQIADANKVLLSLKGSGDYTQRNSALLTIKQAENRMEFYTKQLAEMGEEKTSIEAEIQKKLNETKNNISKNDNVKSFTDKIAETEKVLADSEAEKTKYENVLITTTSSKERAYAESEIARLNISIPLEKAYKDNNQKLLDAEITHKNQSVAAYNLQFGSLLSSPKPLLPSTSSPSPLSPLSPKPLSPSPLSPSPKSSTQEERFVEIKRNKIIEAANNKKGKVVATSQTRLEELGSKKANLVSNIDKKQEIIDEIKKSTAYKTKPSTLQYFTPEGKAYRTLRAQEKTLLNSISKDKQEITIKEKKIQTITQADIAAKKIINNNAAVLASKINPKAANPTKAAPLLKPAEPTKPLAEQLANASTKADAANRALVAAKKPASLTGNIEGNINPKAAPLLNPTESTKPTAEQLANAKAVAPSKALETTKNPSLYNNTDVQSKLTKARLELEALNAEKLNLLTKITSDEEAAKDRAEQAEQAKTPSAEQAKEDKKKKAEQAKEDKKIKAEQAEIDKEQKAMMKSLRKEMVKMYGNNPKMAALLKAMKNRESGKPTFLNPRRR